MGLKTSADGCAPSMRHRAPTVIVLVTALLLVLAGCGSSDDDTTDDSESTVTTAEAGESPTTSGADDPAGVDGLVENLEETQAAQGGGGATLTVGDQTWTFDSVLCAFGPDQIGQEGAELVVSSVQDGLQLYVSIDSFGHSVSLDDIEDFENPSVSLSADPFNTQLAGAATEFIVVDGKDVSAETPFFDGTDEANLEGTPGSLEASCP